MSSRAVARLAWSMCTLSLALTALSLLLLALNFSHPDTHIYPPWLDNTLTAISYAPVGALIASRHPANPVGWLLCLFGLVISISFFSAEYAIYTLLAQPNSLPAGEALVWIASWILPVIIGITVFYILLFPTGRLPGRRWRWLAWLTVAFVLVGMLTFAFSPGAHQGSLGPIKNPLGIKGFDIFFQAVLYTMAPLLFGTAALSVYVRLRQARGVERQQIKWFAYAAAIYAVSIILNVINLGIDAPLWFDQGSTIFFTVVGTMIPLSIGIAILRYRLYDIDILINRTLVYGSLTVTLVALYFGVI